MERVLRGGARDQERTLDVLACYQAAGMAFKGELCIKEAGMAYETARKGWLHILPSIGWRWMLIIILGLGTCR